MSRSSESRYRRRAVSLRSMSHISESRYGAPSLVAVDVSLGCAFAPDCDGPGADEVVVEISVQRVLRRLEGEAREQRDQHKRVYGTNPVRRHSSRSLLRTPALQAVDVCKKQERAGLVSVLRDPAERVD